MGAVVIRMLRMHVWGCAMSAVHMEVQQEFASIFPSERKIKSSARVILALRDACTGMSNCGVLVCLYRAALKDACVPDRCCAHDGGRCRPGRRVGCRPAPRPLQPDHWKAAAHPRPQRCLLHHRCAPRPTSLSIISFCSGRK